MISSKLKPHHFVGLYGIPNNYNHRSKGLLADILKLDSLSCDFAHKNFHNFFDTMDFLGYDYDDNNILHKAAKYYKSNGWFSNSKNKSWDKKLKKLGICPKLSSFPNDQIPKQFTNLYEVNKGPFLIYGCQIVTDLSSLTKESIDLLRDNGDLVKNKLYFK